MRKIIFRAKRLDNGEWVEGNFVKGCIDDFAYIVEFGNKDLCRNYVEVIPETVGQYTGLIDKNGTEIFEGDIVTTKFNERNKPYATIYDEELVAFIGRDKNNFNFTTLGCIDNSLNEIIGNIYDNPELLR